MSKEKIYEDADGTSVYSDPTGCKVYFKTDAGLAASRIPCDLPSAALKAILDHRLGAAVEAYKATEPPPAEEPEEDNTYYSTLSEDDDA